MVLEGKVHGSAPTTGARAATADDLDTLVRLQSDFDLEAFGKNVVGDQDARQLLSNQMAEGAAIVVEEDGHIVSKAEATVAHPWAALVGGVYTVPEERGRGLSTRCMSALCKELLGRVPVVGLNVFEDNHAARRVYVKAGFRIVEEWLTAEMA
jgi:hypothetical protein